MKNFKQFFIERAQFGSSDFYKPKHTYLKDVVANLIAGKKVYLGSKKQNDNFVQLDPILHKDVIRALNKRISSLEEFNKIFANANDKDIRNIRWTSIFKGDFSGYSSIGKDSSNKGNAFEYEYAEQIKTDSNVQKILAKYFKCNPTDIENANVNLIGDLNQKRPLIISKEKIVCGHIPSNFNIGSTVADISIDTHKSIYYLSLKYGNTVSFVNSGIKQIFPITYFKGKTELSNQAKLLLDMLCIDEKMFKKIFNEYNDNFKKSKSQKFKVDITKSLSKNEIFRTFMKSVMGCGYLLVHKSTNGNINYIDLLKESNLDNFISNIISANVLYPLAGSAKRIDVLVEYPNIEFKINIRSKDGGLYPTHIMADYTFKH